MNEATAIQIKKPDASEIVHRVDIQVREADGFQITSLGDHEISLLRERDLRIAEKALTDLFEPSRKAAQAAKTEILRLRDSQIGPIKAARMLYGDGNTAWELKKKAEAEAEEARLRAEAEKQEEERKIQDAIEAEERGEDPDAVLSEEVTVPVPEVKPEVAHVAGSSVRTLYSAEVTDLLELVKFAAANPNWVHVLEAAMPVLNGLARSQRESFKFPGCKLIKSHSRATRSS